MVCMNKQVNLTRCIQRKHILHLAFAHNLERAPQKLQVYVFKSLQVSVLVKKSSCSVIYFMVSMLLSNVSFN